MVLILAAAVGSFAVAQTVQPAKPHVVLILADDLGFNDLGYKNGNKTITPHIDRLVGEGSALMGTSRL